MIKLKNVIVFQDSFDFQLLKETLHRLKEGRKVEVPIYNFVSHSREAKTVSMYGANVLIFEGILAFHDPEILDMLDMKVFVDTDSDIRWVSIIYNLKIKLNLWVRREILKQKISSEEFIPHRNMSMLDMKVKSILEINKFFIYLMNNWTFFPPETSLLNCKCNIVAYFTNNNSYIIRH